MAASTRFGTTAVAAVSTYFVGGTALYCFVTAASVSTDKKDHEESDCKWTHPYRDSARKILKWPSTLEDRVFLPRSFLIPRPSAALCDGVSVGNNRRFLEDIDDTRIDTTVTNDGEEIEDKKDSKDFETDAEDDGYPNFTRHGKNSILARYLTREVYNELKYRKTPKFGVTLEDLIKSGVSLPFGANPPRGMAVFAGDADCYHVFAPLFIPLLEEYHGVALQVNSVPSSTNESRHVFGQFPPATTSSPPTQQPHQRPSSSASKMKRKVPSRLRRQVTNLNPHYVLSQNLDPTGEYILYSRMRVSRSVEGFPFAPSIQRSQRRKVERLFRSCIDDWKVDPKESHGLNSRTNDSFGKEWLDLSANGSYHSVMEMTNAQHADLIQRHILFEDPDELALSAGIGRDWPDARGVYCNNVESPEIMVWCNSEDHLRVISMRKGGDLLGVFTRLSVAVSAVEKSLNRRGYHFASDGQLGFLNTSPSNVGTAFKASVYVKLVRLGQQPGFYDLIQRLRLEAMTRFEGDDKRYTGIFDIANAERLGQTEVELINTMINGVGRLIDLEKKLERGEKVDLSTIR